MPVNLVLHPAAYQMLLLDSPDVPAEDLGAAMRWRIKDLISEPLEDVVVDAFALPEDAYRGRSRRAYCAVLNKARMQDWAKLIKHAGLHLVSIDVTEMAFRNLGLGRCRQSEHRTAALAFQRGLDLRAAWRGSVHGARH